MRLRPRNWNEFQHYKRRNPPWVKLHKRLLDDFEFQSLPLASKALAPMLWLLASEDTQGWIDAGAVKLAFRLRLSERELDQAIQPLLEAGLFEREDAGIMLAAEMQDATPESESESESESEAETETLSAGADRVIDKTIPKDFETFWKAYRGPKNSKKPAALKAWAATSKIRPPLPTLLRAVENYLSWIADESRKQKRDYPKQHHSTWLRGEMWNNYGDGGSQFTPEQIEINRDRADRLMRRGKYAVNYQ